MPKRFPDCLTRGTRTLRPLASGRRQWTKDRSNSRCFHERFQAHLLTLATSAVVPMVVNAWSVAALAQSGDADTEQSTPSGSSPADEPVLLTPRPASYGTKPATMKSATKRAEDKADAPALKYGSYKAAAVATRTPPAASSKRPSSTKVISAAKFDEPVRPSKRIRRNPSKASHAAVRQRQARA